MCVFAGFVLRNTGFDVLLSTWRRRILASPRLASIWLCIVALAGCDEAEFDTPLDRDNQAAVTEEHLFGAAPVETGSPLGEIPAAVAAAEEAELADGEILEAVSYTHLTLPTIYSV